MSGTKFYCAGTFRKSSESMEVINPFTNKQIAKVFLASEHDVNDAIEAAISLKEELKNIPSYKRYEILRQIVDELELNQHHFAETLSLESGKPIRYAIGEVKRAIQTFVVAAEECKRLPKEYIDIDWTPAGDGKEGLVKYFPIGVVAGISPFNFPLNLAVHKIAPAIAAGCPIILKPSSSTPLSTLKLAEIIDSTDLPKGAVSILPANRQTGNILVTDPRINMLSFTGSPDVGWKMKAEAGKKKVVLELGGNAGVIVSETADIDIAVKKCLLGAFAYSGQVCIHTQRIYVQENVFIEFVKKFIPGAENLRSGDPIDPETDISVMIDEANAIRVKEWVKEAVESGAEILSGGARNAAYFEPTVITNTDSTMKVCALEIFGPVVILEKYKDFDQAIEKINESKYGLQAGVFTNNIKEMNLAFNNLEVGGVIINDTPTFRVDHMPYGGMKDSGLGREGVKYAIQDMMEARILVKNKK
ncbi:aldehyde dehydrogenase family protein [Bacteroidota bacterium]